jgi:hypothetical protein
MWPISLSEVEATNFNLVARKSPSPDGFTSYFFHHCWSIIKWDVLALVKESQRIYGVLPYLNSTFLTLVPKEEKVVDPNKFLPISLCNVIYNIISKVITIHLKPLLPTLVTPEQYGYVEGHQILDSILLAHEVSHSLKTTKTSACSSSWTCQNPLISLEEIH